MHRSSFVWLVLLLVHAGCFPLPPPEQDAGEPSSPHDAGSSSTEADAGESGAAADGGSMVTNACAITSVEKLSTAYENFTVHRPTNLTVLTQQDANGIYQLYTGYGAENVTCITCTQVTGGPRVDRQKMMVSIHPSGEWIALGIEADNHDLWWLPQSWQIGFMQSGVWLNIWMTTPRGDRWYKLTDFKPENGPSNGFVGTGFINGGTTAMWSEIVDGNVLVNKFGVWRLLVADFVVRDGVPTFENKRDITPPDALWVEPGGMHPDGRRLLLSTDIGMGTPRDAQGQDQWSYDIVSGALEQLTNTPNVWDEHGVYSPDGKKIVFMSSYPYRDDPQSFQTLSLKTEFMIMNSDGTQLEQLTHFNVPGFPESQPGNTVAAIAVFSDDGRSLFATVMAANFGKTNWKITLAGPCGNRP